ncbi:Dabb family protein [Thermobispora bispora]|uniref:Stress responsive alpha-beta barrel domain protein n=1 Tax=Thermobispora bispora (strain ATCC 19993 / DSM 43833 / CBS 139.67 / JCM 10125 / KCTC 9307 / NBRC 14880 / R51) TaxID=469371 RepID=D6Y956_THEBD|nr:Dabb family protein [Thermobispora bispora]ADG90018.1 Stress responsive alpha-beta barrel domain protein [Thermobispora bispora DSM 43833]
MFRHVVLLRWTEDATEEQKAEVARRLGELPRLIPELKSYRFGPDAGINPGNFSFGLVADFDSPEDYLVYRDHPAHRAVIDECIAPILAERAAVQFALPPDGDPAARPNS